jgi:hypothetical protein
MIFVLPNFLGNIMPKDLGRQIFYEKNYERLKNNVLNE